jgi:P27 family predicted phage terminase small subunit
MAGRKLKLVSNMTGKPGKDKLDERRKSEEQLKQFEAITVTPPKWLDDFGKKEYRRVIKLLKQLPVAKLDQTLIALYCASLSRYIQAVEDVNENGLVLIEDGKSKKNPAMMLQIELGREIRSICGQLGMTIDSRMRIVAPKPKEKQADPFARFGGESNG